jgi:multicomponent Na+:H+ antiporter subunit G
VDAIVPLIGSGIACVFVLLAAIGVVRLPDLYSRMQASSKAATVGAIAALIGCAVHFGSAAVAIRAVALIFFLFLTVPLAAHLIGRAGHIAGALLEDGAIVDDAAKEYRDRAGVKEAQGQNRDSSANSA